MHQTRQRKVDEWCTTDVSITCEPPGHGATYQNGLSTIDELPQEADDVISTLSIKA